MVTGRPALHLSPLDSSRNASLLVLAYSPSNGIITIFRLMLSLDYIEDHITQIKICQEVFEIFMAGVWFLWVETNASKTKNRYKLAYPSCLLKKDVEVNSLSLLSEHWFAFSKRPRCFPTFKQCQQTTTGGEAIWLRTIILGSCLSQNVTDSLRINGTIVVPTAYFSRYKPSDLCYASR